jgi:kinesin family protein 13
LIEEENQKLINSCLNNELFNFKLIGVANLFLDVLYNDVFLPFDYDLPIINHQGEIAGRLRVRLQLLPLTQLNIDNQSDKTSICSNQDLNELNNANTNITPSSTTSSLSGSFYNSKNRGTIKCKLNIIKVYDLVSSVNLSHALYLEYNFWSQGEPTIIHSIPINDEITNGNNRRRIIRFDHENEFTIETNEDFMEYCQENALSLALFVDRTQLKHKKYDEFMHSSKNKVYIEQINTLNQMAKNQSMIDCWAEVSKSFELHVKILELNTEGVWKAVKVKEHSACQTGGVYQLRQGQSRQISIDLTSTKNNSVMWYNGMQFNLELYKIDRVSIGCILERDIHLHTPLDSYQEVDLNKLREKCRQILDNRKSYLYEQLKQLSELNEEQKSDEEKERYESLCKQLVDLGEEQACIDAPADNSHLPGSTIDWQPPASMEQHVPIIFLDLENDSDANKSVQKYGKYRFL